MKVHVVERMKCECCDELYEEGAGADHEPQKTKAYECGECEEVYQDRDEAKECCKP